MKNLILVIITCLSVTIGNTQSKVGTIDVNYIISQMPEIKPLQTQLNEYGLGLDKELQQKISNYNSKMESYNNSVDSFTTKEMQDKQDEIYSLEEEINRYRQNAIQLIRIKEDDLKRPLYQKIAIALEKVAQAEKFTQVISTSDTGSIVYLDPNYDITIKVLNEMGIKAKSE